MPLLQPGSRSPKWQARNAIVTADLALGEAGGAGQAAATATEQAGIARDAADDAIEAAATATSQVGQVFTFQQVRDSYADPGVLSATAIDDEGIVSIAAHQHHYLNSPLTPMVNAGQIFGLLPSTTYQVYYDDPKFEGGAVNYMASPSIDAAIASLEHPARHFVGEVTTPASGGTGTSGRPGSGLPYWKQQQLQMPEE